MSIWGPIPIQDAVFIGARITHTKLDSDPNCGLSGAFEDYCFDSCSSSIHRGYSPI